MRGLSRRAFLAGLGMALVGTAQALEPVGAVDPPKPTPTRCRGVCQQPVEGETSLRALEAPAVTIDVSTIPNLLTRVRISTTNFTNLDHDDAQVTADGTFNLVNAHTGGLIVSQAPEGATFSITNNAGTLRVRRLADGVVLGSFTGPVLVQPLDHARRVQVANVIRGSYGVATYRGYLEVGVAGSTGKVSIVNVLDPGWLADPLEKDLYGVVPLEMPADYGAEALKAQAVAARCYVANHYDGSKVSITDDSRQDQAYYGYIVENAGGNQAVDATRGVVATVNGAVINAMFHAICGGHTEHNENVYTSGSPASYLRGVRCLDDGSWGNISQESAAASFYQGTPASFCDWWTGTYRWTRSWDRATLQTVIDTYLPDVPSTYRPQAYSRGALGELSQLLPVQRGVSGKIRQLRIQNRAGAYWDVFGDYWIRYVLRSSVGSSLQFSSNLVFTHNHGGDGTLLSVSAAGGGWGHGVGLCQLGARGMASRGYDFTAILGHYYSGIALSSSLPPAPTPVSPPSGTLVWLGEPVTLTWRGVAVEYEAEVQGPGTNLLRVWSPETSWTVGTLPVGAHQWRVRGRNASGVGPYCAWQRLISAEHIYPGYLPLVTD